MLFDTVTAISARPWIVGVASWHLCVGAVSSCPVTHRERSLLGVQWSPGVAVLPMIQSNPAGECILVLLFIMCYIRWTYKKHSDTTKEANTQLMSLLFAILHPSFIPLERVIFDCLGFRFFCHGHWYVSTFVYPSHLSPMRGGSWLTCATHYIPFVFQLSLFNYYLSFLWSLHNFALLKFLFSWSININ